MIRYMKAYTINKLLLPVIVSLAVPAVSKAQYLLSFPLPATINTFMVSGVTGTTAVDPLACAIETSSAIPRTFRSIRVWGRSTTPVPMFRVTFAMGPIRTGLPLSPFITVFNGVVAPYRIVSHPTDPLLRQYTLGVTASVTPGRWVVIVARDTRFGTPWLWIQDPSLVGGRFNADGTWNVTSGFVIDLADYYL